MGASRSAITPRKTAIYCNRAVPGLACLAPSMKTFRGAGISGIVSELSRRWEPPPARAVIDTSEWTAHIERR